MESPISVQLQLENVKKLIEQGHDDNFIIFSLKESGADTKTINEAIILIKQIKNKKRTQNGSKLVLAGVLLLGIGFLSCILMYDSGSSINFFLYGLTAIGATILVVGLILIFN